MNLTEFGLNDRIRTACTENYPGCMPGRITAEGTHIYRCIAESGEHTCRVSGAFRHEARKKAAFPVVGDWVALGGEGVLIEGLLPRRSGISRKSAGEKTEEQVLAANIDTAFVVAGLDGGRSFTPRGIERYLITVREGGADPVIVLNKLDMCSDPVPVLVQCEEAAPGVPVILTSTVTLTGMDQLRDSIGEGRTAVMIGPSGVGKSSLINALAGEQLLPEGALREQDRRGRHTSTAGRLVSLPAGGCLIDTPGLRELQLWAGEDSLGGTFQDIEAFAGNCRFRDCSHRGEPGCAVQAAVSSGELTLARYEQYLALQKEIAYLHRRSDEQAMKEETRRWKQIMKSVKAHHKRRERN